MSGIQQAPNLAVQVLLDPGDAAWMPDPGPLGLRAALTMGGVRIIPVPVDTEGVDVASGRTLHPDARLACVSPSHQFPLGSTMSLERRSALLTWAHHSKAWIIEVDTCSEFRYGGLPLAALKVLDPAQCVIYAGTFNTLLFPTLRLGYMIALPDLVEAFVRVRWSADHHSPALEQAVLADFIGAGHLAHHVRQMRDIYADRQSLLIDAIGQELEGILAAGSATAGMHLVGTLVAGGDDTLAATLAAARGIQTLPLSSYCITGKQGNALLLGYTATTASEIRVGVHELALALQT